PRQATLRSIRDSHTGELVDRVLMTYMQAPNSFTGEEMIEISCHGSPVIVRRILDLVLANGARLAEPGEFSLRAVENGKLDLSQAEAIRDLINAQTQAAARQAVRQLNGELSCRLTSLKNKLVETIVRLEAAVEFVEDDLHELQVTELSNGLRRVSSELKELASSFSAGHWLRDGISVTITGRPNVGKSSLFNSLLKRDRAIVSTVPGTTRDTLSEMISITGIPVSLTDTAGVRGKPDEIETIGIDRTHKAIADADLVLFVVDGTEGLTEDDMLLFSRTRETRCLLVANKGDLPGFSCADRFAELGDSCVPVSALTGEGLEQLCETIVRELGVNEVDRQDLLVTDARHYDLLRKTREELEAAIRLIDDQTSEELVLVGLHNALTLLGAITGETTSDQILSEIFATFCIGK
ncbi:MAG TPA: tRNA uridine-5-carboxymethylaminomethyl(34) synthesis GTPase MnmE, partial [Pyrinomonadaceae bacterium]|nr:tRNA uridine-5-carboxymethylaminomethyl(34) synthesis GTPase MnmE [Pyrinomonadaceae bacterium]